MKHPCCFREIRLMQVACSCSVQVQVDYNLEHCNAEVVPKEYMNVKSTVNLAKGHEDLGFMRCFQDRNLRSQDARLLFNGGEESTEAMGEYSDDHPPPEDFATNEVEVLDPVVDDTQLQQQFYEDD
jgi:hypothetical protein